MKKIFKHLTGKLIYDRIRLYVSSLMPSQSEASKLPRLQKTKKQRRARSRNKKRPIKKSS